MPQTGPGRYAGLAEGCADLAGWIPQDMRVGSKMIGKMALLVVVAALAGPVSAEAVSTPKPGSPERKAILDAVRGPIEKELKQEVIFRVNHLKVKDGWAFLKGQPRTKDDKPIDYRGTPFEEQAKEADELLVVVLRHKNDRWEVVKHELFTTDVWWHGIHKELEAPIEIFDYQE